MPMCNVVVEFCTGLSFYPSPEEHARRGLDDTVLGEYESCSLPSLLNVTVSHFAF